ASTHVDIHHSFSFFVSFFFFFKVPPPPVFTPLSLHDALPISTSIQRYAGNPQSCPVSENASGGTPTDASMRKSCWRDHTSALSRSEEHTSELQSRGHLVCRLLLEKKKKNRYE